MEQRAYDLIKKTRCNGCAAECKNSLLHVNDKVTMKLVKSTIECKDCTFGKKNVFGTIIDDLKPRNDDDNECTFSVKFDSPVKCKINKEQKAYSLDVCSFALCELEPAG